jgi:hypothetical protein
MTLSAKWTAVSFFALTALAAGSFAFAGCTVTSGSPSNIEGGPGTTPDSSTTAADSGTGTDAAAPKCEGNMQGSGDFVSPACQAALVADCCTELKGCFNIVVDQDAGGPTDNCDKFVACVDDARKQPTPADQKAAQKLCDLAAPTNIQTAYDAIVACATNHPAANTACQ